MADQRMVNLLNSFPSMRGKGVQEWDGNFITRPADEWGLLATYNGSCSGQRHAIDFCLHVWNSSTDWAAHGYRQFNLASALVVWDDNHREAFVKWVKNPFFP